MLRKRVEERCLRESVLRMSRKTQGRSSAEYRVSVHDKDTVYCTDTDTYTDTYTDH